MSEPKKHSRNSGLRFLALREKKTTGRLANSWRSIEIIFNAFFLSQSKFITLQTTHNTTTTSLQREIDTLRQEQQKHKVQLRELEIGNDDLERNERAVLSSLADIENKYSRVLEEKILLEQELLDKANLEEQIQRLKDELRGEFSTYIISGNHRIYH